MLLPFAFTVTNIDMIANKFRIVEIVVLTKIVVYLMLIRYSVKGESTMAWACYSGIR
jgi:hypothetical protein